MAEPVIQIILYRTARGLRAREPRSRETQSQMAAAKQGSTDASCAPQIAKLTRKHHRRRPGQANCPPGEFSRQFGNPGSGARSREGQSRASCRRSVQGGAPQLPPRPGAAGRFASRPERPASRLPTQPRPFYSKCPAATGSASSPPEPIHPFYPDRAAAGIDLGRYPPTGDFCRVHPTTDRNTSMADGSAPRPPGSQIPERWATYAHAGRTRRAA